MRIVAAILTHNTTTNNRGSLLADCYASLIAEADRVVVVDNGSTDSTSELLNAAGYLTIRNDGRWTTSGAGTNLQAAWCGQQGADLCVLSDDDMWWRPGWADRLRDFWTRAHDDVVLAGCHLEPLFAWNTITGRTTDALYRASTGAASWTFKHGTWHTIGPIPAKRQGWSDVPACMSLRERGLTIAQLDLAEHRGISTWGNGASSFRDEQIQRVRDFLNDKDYAR
jgi:glycosyltransferase involved in cell wall biosynthesis